ncbi:adenylyl cyclase-associated protein [Hirsutella rhossiliensis]|uniref:Adenylyl cyclase-associated protein n=1 Tax=Hirsutella rhossiliensis TaxID=111463 RepID=A0A9P8N072_9HYPO|nr:adenylyl cyclase-associated protein [Hirsutella rhossiliensis]KAH0964449.1 adenylyl cyclase-associated protein [Hirsutella rhossiliensis]
MAVPNTMNSLTTLIKRLEAATSRLEDIATSTDLPEDVSALDQSAASAPNTSTATKGPPGSKPSTSEPLPESIDEFDVLLSSSVDKYAKLSKQLGGVVAQQAAEVVKGFQEQRRFLLITTRAAKPDLDAYQNLLKPTNEALEAVTDLKESNRSDPMQPQLSAVADGIMMLAWVTVDNRPYKHVDECLGSAQFFGNRVLKEHKDRDPKQTDWVHSFYQLFRDLAAYVRQYFPSGVSWNAQGEPALDVAKALSATSGPINSGGAPPPPPPPGPPPVLDVQTETSRAAPSSGGLEAVFSELNKGAAVTEGLRKVDRSEMTHKNPSLRAGSTVADRQSPARAKSPAPGKKPKPESMRVKKPSKKALEGNKWTIENYDGQPQPVEVEASLAQSVLISSCNKTTIIIKGKANQVTVENSSRLSLVVDTLVSTVDAVKVRNFALQVLGTIPTVMLDQVDGAQIYFSKESTGTKLFTSKSDGINLNVVSGPDDDFKEVPLPSQICSYYDEEKGVLVNEIVAHAG